MGAARDTVATTKTEVEQVRYGYRTADVADFKFCTPQEKRSVHVQLQDVTAKAEQLLAELALSKSKCYELERKNEDLNSAMVKRQPLSSCHVNYCCLYIGESAPEGGTGRCVC